MTDLLSGSDLARVEPPPGVTGFGFTEVRYLLARHNSRRRENRSRWGLAGGRLREQRDAAWSMLNDIPGVSAVKPKGALYVFPKLDPAVYPIVDDEKFALDLLLDQKLFIVHGTGFNWPKPDHFRIVTLPRVEDLREAITRLATFLETYTQ